jgi:BirA family biotin operon repressor/biotin-[acetyl-CoA-carboxylase] ligase
MSMLADGNRHALIELAGRVLGACNTQGTERIREAVDGLRALGMSLAMSADHVEARPFAPLDRPLLERYLTELALTGSTCWRVRVVGSSPSTNSDLLRVVRTASTFVDPALLITEVQRAGRGRLGRRWTSAPGAALSASFALRVERRLSDLDGVTLVCGLAVHDVAANHGVRAELKWPNDVLVDGRKLGGILVEAHAIGDATVLVIGVGINVLRTEAIDQEVLPAHALQVSDLASCGGHELDRNQLAAEVASSLESRLATFSRAGFAAFTNEWNAVDAFRNRAVVLRSVESEPRSGIARGVDDRGALLLEVDGVRTRVISGDVSMRPVEAGA